MHPGDNLAVQRQILPSDGGHGSLGLDETGFAYTVAFLFGPGGIAEEGGNVLIAASAAENGANVPFLEA